MILVVPVSCDAVPFGIVAHYRSRYPEDFKFFAFAAQIGAVVLNRGPVWTYCARQDIAWLPVRQRWHDVEPVDISQGIAELNQDIARMFPPGTRAQFVDPYFPIDIAA